MTKIAFTMLSRLSSIPAIEVKLNMLGSLANMGDTEEDLAFLNLMHQAMEQRMGEVVSEATRLQAEKLAEAKAAGLPRQSEMSSSAESVEPAPVPPEPEQTPASFFSAEIVFANRMEFVLPSVLETSAGSSRDDGVVPELHAEVTILSGGFRSALELLRLLYSFGLTDPAALDLALTIAGYPDLLVPEEEPFKHGFAQFDTLLVHTLPVADVLTGTKLPAIHAEFRIRSDQKRYPLVLMLWLLRVLIRHHVVSPKTLHTVLLATGHRRIEPKTETATASQQATGNPSVTLR